jgi:ribosomal protein L10
MKAFSGIKALVRRDVIEKALQAYGKDRPWDCLELVAFEPVKGLADVVDCKVTDRLAFIAQADKSGAAMKALAEGHREYNGKTLKVRGTVSKCELTFTSHGVETKYSIGAPAVGA